MFYGDSKAKMADVIGFYLSFPPFARTSLCSLNTLIHRRIWTSYKFRKMDGLDRGCRESGRVPRRNVNIPWGTNNEGRNSTKLDKVCYGPWGAVYCPQTTVCALQMRGVYRPRFRSLLCQVSQFKSSFFFFLSLLASHLLSLSPW